MALALVPRGVRALSDHINSYFRVLRGADPDSVALRLNTGGSFEVRHSVTGVPVLKVTDAGFEGTVGEADIEAGSVTNTKLGPNAVTTDKIADGTVVPADINGQATVSKILATSAGGVVGWVQATAAMILPLNVGTQHIAGGGTGNRVLRTTDGTNTLFGQVAGADIAAGNVTSDKLVGAGAGDANTVLRTTTGTAVAFGKVLGADIATGNVTSDKMIGAGAGDANTVLRTTTGTGVVFGKVLGADIAAGNVTSDKMIGAGAGDANTVLRTTTGTAVAFGKVAGADIAAGNVTSDKLVGAGAGDANTVLRTTTGTAVAFGKVGTADLAPQAVSQAGVSAGFTQSTTSASYVTIPGDGPGSEVRIDLTTQANSTVMVWLVTTVSNTAAGNLITVALSVDGGAEAAPFGITAPVAGYAATAASYSIRQTLTAGTHQFRARWKTSGGTATLNLGILMAVELKA